jgi:hypothetical protein
VPTSVSGAMHTTSPMPRQCLIFPPVRLQPPPTHAPVSASSTRCSRRTGSTKYGDASPPPMPSSDANRAMPACSDCSRCASCCSTTALAAASSTNGCPQNEKTSRPPRRVVSQLCGRRGLQAVQAAMQALVNHNLARQPSATRYRSPRPPAHAPLKVLRQRDLLGDDLVVERRKRHRPPPRGRVVLLVGGVEHTCDSAVGNGTC